MGSIKRPNFDFESLIIPVILIIALLSDSFLISETISSTVGNIILILTYSLVLLYFVLKYNHLTVPRYFLLFVVVLLSVKLFHLLAGNVGSLTLALMPVYMLIFLIVNVIYIPSVFSFDEVAKYTTYLIFILVTLGFLVSVIGINIQFVNPGRHTIHLPVIDVEIRAIRSVFDGTRNQAGRVFFVGCITALYVYRNNRTKINFLLLVTIFSGLLLTTSRGALMATGIALIIITLHRIDGRMLSLFIFSSGLFVLLFYMFLLSGNLPRIIAEGFPSQPRIKIWESSIDLLNQNSPLYGYGLVEFAPKIPTDVYDGNSPHSVFVYVYLQTGIIGFLSYMALLSLPILNHIKSKVILIYPTAIVLGFAANHIIGGSPIYFPRLHAILPAIALGYLLIHPLADNTNMTTRSS